MLLNFDAGHEDQYSTKISEFHLMLLFEAIWTLLVHWRMKLLKKDEID